MTTWTGIDSVDSTIESEFKRRQDVRKNALDLFAAHNANAPLLVYHLPTARALLARIQRLFPKEENYEISLSVKSMPDLVPRIVERASAASVASLEELSIIRQVDSSCRASIYCDRPAHPAGEARRMYEAGVSEFVVQSVSSFTRLDNEFNDARDGVRLVCRIRGDESSLTLGEPSKFGCQIDEAVGLLSLVAKTGYEHLGISFNIGTQLETPSSWSGPIKRVASVLAALPSTVRSLIEVISIGGGWPASFDDVVPDVDAYSTTIRELRDAYLNEFKGTIRLEVGRAVGAEAGYLCGEIVAVEKTNAIARVFSTLGIYNGAFGGRGGAGGKTRYTIFTPLERGSQLFPALIGSISCSGSDVLQIAGGHVPQAEFVNSSSDFGGYFLPEVVEDDVIVLAPAGAYAWTMDLPMLARPQTVVVDDPGEVELLSPLSRYRKLHCFAKS